VKPPTAPIVQVESDRIAISRLGHLGLTATDLDAAIDFYAGVLGLEVSDRLVYPENRPVAEGVWLRCGTDHHCVSIFRPRDPAAGARAAGVHHLAFELASFDDLLHAYRAVKRRGLPVEARLGGPGWQLRFYTSDPDGNTVELYWDQDQIGWDGRSRPFVPIEYDLDLERFDLESYLRRKLAPVRGTQTRTRRGT